MPRNYRDVIEVSMLGKLFLYGIAGAVTTQILFYVTLRHGPFFAALFAVAAAAIWWAFTPRKHET